MKKVSVVLPTHNRADLLPQALASVCEQAYRDLEIIVVDDASSDATPEIVAEWFAKDSRIRSIRNNPNQRLPRSLNIGFAASSGDYLTWTSDDNLYHPGAIGRMVEVLEAAKDAAGVYASMNIVDHNLNPKTVFRAKPVEEQSIQPWCGACFLYRREAYEKVGDYNPEMVLAEDLDYWIRLRQVGPLLPIDEVLYDYREHEGSLSSNFPVQVADAGAKVVISHLGNMPWLQGKPLGETYLALASHAYRKEDVEGLRKYLKLAIKLCPATVVSRFKRGVLSAALGRII